MSETEALQSWSCMRRMRRLSQQQFKIISEKVVEREIGIREESCDYKLKIAVAIAESTVHMMNHWHIKILQRVKLHSLVKS